MWLADGRKVVTLTICHSFFQGVYFNHKEIKSMETHSRISEIFRSMKKRCYNPKNINYKYYGARGVELCEEWNNRELVKISGFNYTKGYLAFKKWALENGYAEGLTIDRIDVNGNYEPSNCRWVDWRIQSNNRRDNHYLTYKGKTQSMAEWCRELGLNYELIRNRIRSNWSVEKAFETPVRK